MITRRHLLTSGLLLFVTGCASPKKKDHRSGLVPATKARGRKIYRNFVWREVRRGPNNNRRVKLLVISKHVRVDDQVVIEGTTYDVKAMRPGKMDIAAGKTNKTINTFISAPLKDDGEPI